jgi:hypothetical protein
MTRLGVRRLDLYREAVRAKGSQIRRTDRPDDVRDDRAAQATLDPRGRFALGRVLDLLPRRDEGGVDAS